jgi:hypothetical protein
LTTPVTTSSGARAELLLRAPWPDDFDAVRRSPIQLGGLVWVERLSGVTVGDLLELAPEDLERCTRAAAVLVDLHGDTSHGGDHAA